MAKKILEKGGKNYYGHQFWTFYVPDDWLMKGLEIGIVTDEDGLRIGGETITWKALDKARAGIDEMPK